MRRFWLYHDEDATGISGTGPVADGVAFDARGDLPGKVALAWHTEHTSVAVYDSIADVEAIHGHNGRTRIVWVDPPRCHKRDLAHPSDHAGSPISEGDLVLPVALLGDERTPLYVKGTEQRKDGAWWVSAIGWPECGYGAGTDRAENVVVVRAGAVVS